MRSSRQSATDFLFLLVWMQLISIGTIPLAGTRASVLTKWMVTKFLMWLRKAAILCPIRSNKAGMKTLHSRSVKGLW